MISVISRPIWSTEQVPGQPDLHSETLSQTNKIKTQKIKLQQYQKAGLN
jgi:Uma2 family endonuclease